MDAAQITQRAQSINPFVAELNGEIVGYADLQSNGYIDHFFVSGFRPRSGIGTILMKHLISEAKALELTELTSDVSRTAQPFFKKFGFSIVEQRNPEVRGIIVPNALMHLRLPHQ
jgi:putative acetyltransferase